jgi:hypothetical protein
MSEGWLIWLIMLWPFWSPTLNVVRWRNRHRPDARPNVSRNAGPDRQAVMARLKQEARETGPKWEQDAPYPEVFEEDDL